MHAKVANSNPTNYIFLRSAINTLSIEHIKSPFFQNFKISLECLTVAIICILNALLEYITMTALLEYLDLFTTEVVQHRVTMGSSPA